MIFVLVSQGAIRYPRAMKRPIVSLLAVFAVATAHAGSFGGPPPFKNGSPLTSGTDGTYQAVASGTNVTGLFSWHMSGGAQTPEQGNNSWIFFVDGEILSGQTSAVVSRGKVVGILDSTTSSGVPTTGNGTITLPLVFIIPGNTGSGQFTGKIDLNSPIAYFSGQGNLSGTAPRVDQIVFLRDAAVPVTIVPITIPGSTLGNIAFKFRGSRVSTQ